MRASATDRAARRWGGRLAVALSLLAAPAAALAQGAPTSLLPPPAVQPPPPPPAAPGALPSPIQVESLGALDPDGMGTLTPAQGGFAGDWQGMPAALLLKRLGALSAAPSSPELASLQRRLLLSALAPPADIGAMGTLIEARARALLSAGDLDDLAALLRLVPPAGATPGLTRIGAEAALLGGDAQAACASQPAAATNADSFPAELAVFCQFAGGQPRDAELALDLLRDQKLDDPAFFALADLLDGVIQGVAAERLAAPTPVTLAMAVRGKAALPVPAATVTDPGLLRAIALAPDATAAARLVAGERAYAVGALDADTLARIYLSQPVPAADLDAIAATPAGAPPTPQGRALLFQIAAAPGGTRSPAQRAQAISTALAGAAAVGGYVRQALLYAAPVASLSAGPDLAGFAADAVRVLAVSGRADAAKAWLAALQGSPNGAAALAPLPVIAGLVPADPALTAALADWRKGLSGLPAPVLARRGEVALSLLDAVGDPPSDAAWQLFDDDPQLVSASVPRPALWQGLRMAADAGQVPATVLLGLATLGTGDLAAADPTQLYRVVAALDHVGLHDDARALAVEAAVANGL